MKAQNLEINLDIFNEYTLSAEEMIIIRGGENNLKPNPEIIKI